MFKRVGRGLAHTAVIAMAMLAGPRRKLLRRMIDFGRKLPGQFNQPLPDTMAQLTPQPGTNSPLPPHKIRRLADAVAAWQLGSPLGICLRRSLLRYHFLQQAGVPVRVVFGARLKGDNQGSGIGGHAWLTLHGQPYYENPADYRDFAVMYSYPPEDTCQPKTDPSGL